MVWQYYVCSIVFFMCFALWERGWTVCLFSCEHSRPSVSAVLAWTNTAPYLCCNIIASVHASLFLYTFYYPLSVEVEQSEKYEIFLQQLIPLWNIKGQGTDIQHILISEGHQTQFSRQSLKCYIDGVPILRMMLVKYRSNSKNPCKAPPEVTPASVRERIC